MLEGFSGIRKLAIFFVFALSSLAQTPSTPQAVTIAGAERRILRSTTNNVDYQIDVALPRGYAASEKRYPVFYILDGNAHFGLLTDSYRLLRLNGLIPDDMIIVGIGYPGTEVGLWSDAYAASRTRDYTPSPTRWLSRSDEPPHDLVTFMRADMFREGRPPGGAPAFLTFLRQELIPFIDSTYRTVPGNRGLMGHSYGGLFCVYILTHRPDSFQKYAIGSPALWWDDEAALRWEAEYAGSHKELPARVYMYVGSLEPPIMSSPPKRLWDMLQSRHYTGLDLVDFVIVPDESHASINTGSLGRALRALCFNRQVSFPVEVLQRYVGEWKAAERSTWNIRLDDKRLVIDSVMPGFSSSLPEAFPAQELFAESETVFFTKISSRRFVFTLDPSTKLPTEMRVNGAGSALRRVPAKR